MNPPCVTLQHTATHCNTEQHTVTHCNTLQQTATHCNTLQHTATHCNALQRTATHCSTCVAWFSHVSTRRVSTRFRNTISAPLISLSRYGVATVSRIDQIIGLFCKRDLSKRRYSAKETYNFIDPTDCSHPILSNRESRYNASRISHHNPWLNSILHYYLSAIHLHR